MERVPLESSQHPGPKRTLSLEPLEPRLLLQADWTFMVYMDGDNSLESAAVADFLEMAHVGSTADVNVVAQFDRSALDQTSGGAGYTNSYGDWSDTRRGLIAQNDVPDTTWGTSIGEADMGASSTLQDFLTWAVNNYQANHYALVIWGDGTGYNGVGTDQTDGSVLTLSNLSSGMSGALAATGVSKFDVVDFDHSLVGMVEVGYQVKDVAGIMVSTEDNAPINGLPYDTVLGDLTSAPLMAPSELANDMAQSYLTYYSFTGTYAVTDLTQMGPLAAALGNFGTTFMNNGTATDRYQLSQHWQTAPSFGNPDYLDIGVLMTDISGDNLMSPSIRTAADNVLGVYADAIIGNYSGSLSGGGSGLAVYMPDDTGTVDPNYDAGNLSFAADTQWDEFLAWWTGTPGASWTFMVYMGADNDLEQFAIQDFLEMASIGSSDAVNIVVQLDRAAGYDTSYGDWTDTRRGIVEQGDVPDTTWGTSIGEADMGAPSTLTDFVTWAMTNYPAAHYSLTLWDHGGGLDGAIWDYNDGTPFANQDNLTVAEIGQALQADPQKVDILRFDACDMSLLEMAYQVRNDASYMVGSEDLGWAVLGQGILSPYQQVLQQLTTNPSQSPHDLAVLMANLYYHSWSIGNLTIMNSVVDLSRVGALANAVDNLAQTALTSGTTEDRVLMQQYENSAPSYPNPTYVYPSPYRDLGTWLDGVANDANMSSAVSQAASDALDAYYSAVVANFAAPGTGTGLAIYMPGTLPDGSYNWQNYAFAADTRWADFLNWWAANEVSPLVVYQSGAAKVSFYDVQGVKDIDPSDIIVKMSGTNVKSIVLAGMNPMQGLGIVISGATSVGKIQDARTNPGDIAFIASNVGAKSVQINSSIDGEWLNGRSLGGVIFPSDIDGDGNTLDTTALYFGGGVGKLTVTGSVYGGAYINGAVKSFQLNNGDLVDDFLIEGDASKIQFTGMGWGGIWSRLYVGGDVKRLDMPDGTITSESILDITGSLKKADIGYIDAGTVDITGDLSTLAAIPVMSFDPSTFAFTYSRGGTLRVGNGIGKIDVGWFTPGSIFYPVSSSGGGTGGGGTGGGGTGGGGTGGGSSNTNALVDPTTGTDQRYFIQYLMSNVLSPSIQQLTVEGGMANARILAGADLGADLLPGGTGANADTYGVGYIGKINVGTALKKWVLYGMTFSDAGPDGTGYGAGEVGDSLIAAGAFSSDVPGFFMPGGSGYNLVTLHDNYLFEDGSYIGKVQIGGQLVSRYSELAAAGDDFSTATPPQYPFYVPFGIGSYAMGKVTIGGAPASAVSTFSSFGIWERYPYLFVEVPRGLGANA